MESRIFTASFDDGDPMDLKVANLFARYGLPCTFYVPLSAERPVLKPDEIRSLASAFEIGGHGLTHRPLTVIRDTEAWREIADSRKSLEDIIGAPVAMFCFPGGRFRSKHLDMLGSAGYLGVRTCELLSLAYPRTQRHIAVLPTTLQLYDRESWNYVINLASRGAVANAIHLRAVHSRSLLESMEIMLQTCLRTGGVFHLWGHGWEIDSGRLWETLESALKMVAALRPRVVPLNNSQVIREAACGGNGNN